MAKLEIVEGTRVKLLLTKSENGVETVSPGTYTVKKILEKHAVKVEDDAGFTMNALRNRLRPVTKQPEEEETMTEAATLTKKETTTTKPEKTKIGKKKEAPEPFDIHKFITSHGGIALKKECTTFDHKEFALTSYVVIDKEEGFYYYVNLYKYPDGTLSRCGAKDAKYPLKGTKCNYTVKDKKTGETEKKQTKGKETPEELVIRFEKKGYAKSK